MKKDILYAKMKKKPQQGGRKGEIAIKSHPIHAEWVIYNPKNNYATDVLLQE